MAIGQLYDYRRLHEPPVRLAAVLLPRRPNPDRLTCFKAQASKRFGPGTVLRDSWNGTLVEQ